VTVAISTYRRADSLPRLIKALEDQTLPSSAFEVVIVDDGSPDDTMTVLRTLSAGTPLHLRVLHQERNRGQAAGRNVAWRDARAPLIAFTDDDCVPTPEWLEQGTNELEARGGIVIGRTLPNPDQIDKLRMPFARTVEDEGTRFYNTCNIFYRRADLEAIGGFDEGFSAHGGEDMDIALRVLERGADANYVPDALVFHDVHAAGFTGAVRDTWRWTGIPQAVARHPNIRDLLVFRVFWKRSHLPALVAATGIALAGFAWPALLLVAPWLWYRTVSEPFCPGPRRRLIALPGGFLLDLLEVLTMIRGSVRYRTVVL
jgi:glycosyltransferase involved in cell wall biosynthesis